MSTIRKVCRGLCYSLLGVLSVAIVLAGGGALWLWGWTLKSAPNFHASWTPEEREAIAEFDLYLRQQFAHDMSRGLERMHESFVIFGWKLPELGLREQLMIAYAVRCYAAPISDMLHEAAESGNAAQTKTVSFHDDHGFTPTILAAQTAHLKALEALVRHGASPNATAYNQPDEYTEAMKGETPLSPLLNGQFTNGRRLSWDERRATAEFLLEHGADINVSDRMHRLSCDIPLMVDAPEADAPWLWALNHGLRMKTSDLSSIIVLPSARTLVEKVLREKLIDINAVDGETEATVLQSMLRRLRYNVDGELSDEEWEARFDMLLAAGADPNLVGGKGAQPSDALGNEGEFLIYSNSVANIAPSDIVKEALERASAPARRDLCLRVLEKLRAAGARSATTE